MSGPLGGIILGIVIFFVALGWLEQKHPDVLWWGGHILLYSIALAVIGGVGYILWRVVSIMFETVWLDRKLSRLTAKPPPEPAKKEIDFYAYRASHMHVMGGTSAGKTTLLEHFIVHDLQNDTPPSVVVIDSQTQLIRRLTRLEYFNFAGTMERDLGRKICIIDPRDTPAMNVFALDQRWLAKCTPDERVQYEQGVIETLDYFFSSIFGAEFTGRQSVMFRHIARLMIALPQTMSRNATMFDLLKFMQDPEPFRAAIERLSPIAQNYFQTTFFDKTTARASLHTREEVTNRLHRLLENPVMAKLLTAETDELKLFGLLEGGYFIFVDTAKDYLRSEASAIFGRMFITRLLQVIQERAAYRDNHRVHVYIDEAHEYLDQNIDELLVQARKQNVGITLAHQYMGQCSDQLWASISANTGIKMASRVSARDARALAPDLHCEVQELLDLPRFKWMTYARGLTHSPIWYSCTKGQLDNLPRMNDDDYTVLRRINRAVLQPEKPPEPQAKDTRTPGPARNSPALALPSSKPETTAEPEPEPETFEFTGKPTITRRLVDEI